MQHAKRIGPVDPEQIFDVTIELNRPQAASVQTSSIDDTLSPADLLKDYGASQKDADEVAKSLGEFGLKVDSVSLETRSMKVSGTAAAMEAAFKPNLSMMQIARSG